MLYEVITDGIEAELAAWGVGSIRRWTRGVDTELFRPRDKALFDHLPRPVSLYVGRVAVEKNIEAFLALDLPGTKVVVGDGPQRAELEKRFPKTVFAGAKAGEDLARHYAAADVFVFPSRTRITSYNVCYTKLLRRARRARHRRCESGYPRRG